MLINSSAAAKQLGGQVVGGNMARNFLGAHVDRTGLSSIVIASGGSAVMDFVAGAYDVGGWFDAGDPTKFTVPAGVTRIRHWYECLFTGSFSASRSVFIDGHLNGSHNAGYGRLIYQPFTNVFNDWNYSSPSYPVVEGDEIEVNVFVNLSNSNVTVFGSPDCSFAVEAVTVEF